MKKRISAAALALVLALACAAPAMAMPEPRAYEMGALSGICEDGEDLLVTDVHNKVIWRFSGDEAVRAAGRIGVAGVDGVPIGGYVDGALENALFEEPWAIAPYLEGFAVTDAEANVVRWFDGETVRTIAGSGRRGNRNDIGTGANFNYPTGLAAGPDGELYVADTGNGTIRRISPEGRVTTWARGLSEPTGICWADGALYVAETGGHCVSKISGGSRVVVAGTQGEDGWKDGPAEGSLLRTPMGVAVGPDGSVYISDTGNSAIRRLRDGRVMTMASDQAAPGAPAQPRGLLVRDGTLLAADELAGVVMELPLAAPAYSDVAPGSVFAPYVEQAVERGLSVGTGEGRFSPDLPVTRGMFVTMLTRLHHSVDGDEVIDGEPRFSDVPSGSYYEAGINWCADRELVLGSEGLFRPDRAITREELVTILYRYAVQDGGQAEAEGGDLSRFTDGAAVSDYAKDAVSWAVGAGLLQGTPAGALDPTGVATRAQAVTILIRFMDAAGL